MVSMLMVLIVDVFMIMLQWFVPVLVAMPFGQMEPDANAHEYSGSEKRNGEAFAQSENRDHYPKERSYREIGSCPGCTDMAQR